MMRKRRKPLNDSLAQQFVYGEDEPSTRNEKDNSELRIPNSELSPEQPQGKELSLMDKLQVQPKEATKRFTVDLTESMHRKLSILAAKTGRTKADIVRVLLDEALKDVSD